MDGWLSGTSFVVHRTFGETGEALHILSAANRDGVDKQQYGGGDCQSADGWSCPPPTPASFLTEVHNRV